MTGRQRKIRELLLLFLVVVAISFLFMCGIIKIIRFVTERQIDNEIAKSNEFFCKYNTISHNYLNFDDVNNRIGVLSTELDDVKKSLIVSDSKRTIKLKSEETINLNLALNDVSNVLTESQLDQDEIVATDVITGADISSNEIIDETVVIPYKEDGYEILFCGQYNSAYHWNGPCVINAYKEGILKNITEAYYEDGDLLSYKQAFLDSGKWYTSKRSVVGKKEGMSINYGETWIYQYTNDIYLSFDFEKATSKDMMTVDRLRLNSDSFLIEYYQGITWDGKYNDDSGDAMMIKYNPNGKVKTLYKGCFKNGLFDDYSGNAWEITNEKDTRDYYYYSGIFRLGKRPKHGLNQKPISYSEINDILNKNNMNLSVEWE